MRKIIILVLILLLIAGGLIFSTFTITGKTIIALWDNKVGYFDPSEIPFDYSYTTAICDGNKCRDFVVTCLDGEAIHLDPVSGMVIFPDYWEDSRERNGFCAD